MLYVLNLDVNKFRQHLNFILIELAMRLAFWNFAGLCSFFETLLDLSTLLTAKLSKGDGTFCPYTTLSGQANHWTSNQKHNYCTSFGSFLLVFLKNQIGTFRNALSPVESQYHQQVTVFHALTLPFAAAVFCRSCYENVCI